MSINYDYDPRKRRRRLAFLLGVLSGIALGLLILSLLQRQANLKSAGKEPLSVIAEAPAETQRKGGGGFGKIPDQA